MKNVSANKPFKYIKQTARQIRCDDKVVYRMEELGEIGITHKIKISFLSYCLMCVLICNPGARTVPLSFYK